LNIRLYKILQVGLLAFKFLYAFILLELDITVTRVNKK